MGFFWFVLGIAVILSGFGVWLLIRGYRMYHDPDRRGYPDGDGLMIIGGCILVVPAIMFMILVGVGIDRHYSEVRCDKKAAISSKPFVWVDYHYFGYDCLLRTPSGNITETPVLPLEDVTERSGG